MFDTYQGIAPEVDPWTRTVAIYRVARKAGARLRARDLIAPDPERWFKEWAGPLLGRIARLMSEQLEERIRQREAALGMTTEEMTLPPQEGLSNN